MLAKKESQARTYGLALVVIIVVVIADRVTKYLVSSKMTLGQMIEVIPGFFNLTFIYNRGIAFGMFADLSDEMRFWVIGVAMLAALAAVLYFFFVEYHHDVVARVCLAMIVGGAIGNLIDRAQLGKVIDFLDFYYASFHWPAFNVADSAICVGVCILIFRKPADKK